MSAQLTQEVRPRLLRNRASVDVKTETSPILVKIEGRLKEIVQKAHPEATIRFRDELHDELVCEYETQIFMIHTRNRFGTLLVPARHVEGPNVHGFLVRICVTQRSRGGSAVQPFGIKSEIYWHRYINEYEIPGGQDVVKLELSYGGGPNTKLLREIRTLCAEFGTPVFKIDKKPELLKEGYSLQEYDSAEQAWAYFRDIDEAK